MNRCFPRGVAIALAAASVASGYIEVAPPEHVVLPPARSPAQSLAAIKVPADLVVELVAAEPMVMDPIDVAWDADGRMWVVEMADYPMGMDGKGKPGGRVRVLESTKGDGHYDKMTLFADGLSFPTSVMPWRNGVLVTAIPDILYLEDTDGDGRADRSVKLFTGLTEGNQQHRANGLQWGLDGWLHLANGNSGGKLSSLKSGQVLDLGQRDFRIAPDDGRMELQSGQSQFGRNRDDWGNWFGCNNSNPIWHYALEEHYLRRNPHLVPPNSTVTVAAIPGAARVYPVSQTLARFNDPQGENHFTSASAVMIYRDELLGPQYAGNVFVCEPVHNLVHRELIQPAGATFASRRAPAEQTSEFFASADSWSRFTAVRTGPDGALYLVDMYRLVIEHPKWIPEAWQKRLGNLIRAGDDQGRIYRVRPRGVALRSVPRLSRANAAALVAALENPSGTVRDLAQQQLQWRQEKSAVPALERLLAGAVRPETRVQALSSLESVGGLTPAAIGRALGDPHPGVRRRAVRLSEIFSRTSPGLLPGIVRLVDDPDGGVRQQVAYTLGEWTEPAAGVALAQLLRTDEDRFIRAAAMSSALAHGETMIAELEARGGSEEPALIEIAIVTRNTKTLSRVLSAIGGAHGPSDSLRQFNTMALVLDRLQRNNSSLAQLQTGADAALRQSLGQTDGVFAAARTVSANAGAPLDQRLAAVRLLGRGRGRQPEDIEVAAGLLVPQLPVELQLAAVAAMGRMNQATVPERLLAGWESYGRPVRATVLDLLLSRPAWTNVLLDRVVADAALRAQIDSGRRATLVQSGNARVAERAKEIFNAGIDVNRQKVVDRYLAAMASLRGDPVKGGAVFATICSACHKLGDIAGRPIGPDLATLSDRSPAYLITHILDPNRAVEDRYVLYTAVTQDGRNLAGMLAGEAGNSITFVELDGVEQVILRGELKSLTSTGRSLMPDGLEAAVNEQAMTDLVAFIAAAGRGPPGGGKTP